MSLLKFTANDTPKVLKTAEFDTFEFARLAHLNNLVDQINALPGASYTPLNGVTDIAITPITTGSAAAAIVTQTNAQFAVIEAKINEIIAELS
jgi:hypothetical protein